MFFALHSAALLFLKKEEYVCAAGVSPSGSVHIGNFRDFATPLFVVKALQKLGKKAKPDHNAKKLSKLEREKMIEQLTAEMRDAAKRLEFEQAAYIRDRIKELRNGK